MNGPGTELKLILSSLGIAASESCNCTANAMQMNEWGPEGCRLHRAEIVEWLVESKRKHAWHDSVFAGIRAITTRLAFCISVADPLGSLVDIAIERAEHDALKTGKPLTTASGPV